MRRIVFGALALCFTLPAAAATLTATVVGVTDGDTLTVRDAGHATHEVRLANIDAPETTCHLRRPGRADDACVDFGQPHAREAKRVAMSLLYGKTVTIVLVQTHHRAAESYSRLIGTVYRGRMDVNYELVRRGLAWHEKNYARRQQGRKQFAAYHAAETAARRQRLGLWADRHPIPPWQWRHEHPMAR